MITQSAIKYVKDALKNDRRLDGRKLDEFRDMEITRDVSVNAEGCARVKLGRTEVIAGIKFGLGTPYPDSPDKGAMTTAIEFPPLGDPAYEAGMPKPEEVEITRVVDRAIRESGAIDFSKLCIEPGKQCYMMFIDMTVINNDGNVLDAAGIAGAAALMGAKLPKVTKNEDDTYTISREEFEGELELETIPISITVRKTEEGKLLVDPSIEEEAAATARVTVGSKSNDHIASLQMSGSGGFTPEETAAVFDLAVAKATEIREAHFK